VLHPDKGTKLNEVTDGTSHTVMVGERPSGPNGFHSNWYAGWGFMHFYRSTLMPVDRRYANSPVMSVVCPRVSVYQAGRYDDPCHDYHFWSLHDGGANFLFVDGGTRFLPYSAVEVLSALATKAGGEVAGEW
jgi:prepilin-type processing-associated H-X9-DG protein